MINPFKSKKGLGRGLSSLIGDGEVKASNNKISISSIVPNKLQPRKKFEKEGLEELTNSIKERGVIQPLIVRKSDDQDNIYELIAGERRLQASQSAGLHEVPVVIIEADDLKSLEFAIVENVQRKDLNPIEEAEGYQKLIDKFGYDQEKVSRFIGKSRSHVTNCLRLLKLPNRIIQAIANNELSPGHAKVLVGIDNAQLVFEKILKKKLSVRQTENLVRLLKFPNRLTSGKHKDPNIIEIENTLADKIGIKVNIRNQKNNKGSITFEYKELGQLDRLFKILKENY